MTSTLLGTKTAATAALTSEHRRIREVLKVLGHACDAMEAGHSVPPTLLPACAEYFRNYVEACHEHREERILFPLILSHRDPGADHQVDEMVREHALGRRYLGALERALSLDDKPRVIEAARAYIHLMGEHFLKEDYTLFPAANRVLSVSDQQALERTFARLQREEEDDGIRGRYEATIRDLVAEEGIL